MLAAMTDIGTETGTIAAVPAGATGQFEELPVAPALRDSFACVWIHRMPAAAAPPVIVAPDATIDLQWIGGAFRIAGPDKVPKTEIIPSATSVIGFRFRPGAAAAFLGVPASGIADQRLMLDDLWGSRAHDLARDIRTEVGDAGLLASLQDVLARCAPQPPTADRVMPTAFALIESGPPPGIALVPWLGRALAMSERTLRRRFDEAFGYGPKTLDRILRYQRFLKLRRQDEGSSTAALAAEAGYADQAHLVRESRRLTGATPRQLV